MEKFVKIPKSIISIEEKLAMTGILMSSKNDNETITSIVYMEKLLTRLGKSNRKTQDVILSGLKSLNEKEMISIKSMPNKVSDFFEVIINTNNETFTIMYYEEIRTIMGGNYNGVNRDLFHYYSTLASFYNNNTKVAYPSIDMLSKMTGLHMKTIQKYNKILQELNIIHIENNGQIQTENGIQSLRNTYSRKEDSELCKMESNKYKNLVESSGTKIFRRQTNNSNFKENNIIDEIEIDVNMHQKKYVIGLINDNNNTNMSVENIGA